MISGFFILFNYAIVTAMHRSGFVNIIGRPNAGKSTLMNALLGEKLSIVTPKAQTTRHRIIGVLNGDDYQIVFSDTPGIVFEPKYQLHKTMMQIVSGALEDADVIIFLTDIFEKRGEVGAFLDELKKIRIPKILAINKIDLAKAGEWDARINEWQDKNSFSESIGVSALKELNLDKLLELIIKYLPEHPPYYQKDELTDRSVRYFVSEIIREKIFFNYKQEVPYSCEVIVADYKEDKDIDRVRAEIIVERNSQKAILIGDKGSALKKVGIAARKDIEALVGKKVYLELFVKVKPGWRDDENSLRSLGYLP